MGTANISRRTLLSAIPALGIGALASPISLAQASMPARRIPGTDESLPIVGLGSSKPVSQIASRGTEPIRTVLRALIANGGSVVDTWPRNPANDAAFGEVISSPDLRNRLFVASKIDRVGREEGIHQFEETLRLYQRESVDLLQVFSLTDLATQWRNALDFREQGKTRYVGATVAEAGLHDDLLRFAEKERPDFVQVNYSISEREAESRVLPALRDLGIAVVINRPFMNGALFSRLGDKPVPEWASEFGADSWAEFSLKYVLPHTAITCVLTETSNPAHMAENARAAFGALPDERQRQRMAQLIDSL